MAKMVVGAGFEPAKLARQIYSLIPLAAREPHRRKRAILLTAPELVNQKGPTQKALSPRKY